MILLATSQLIIGNQKNTVWNNVCDEILMYGKFKRAQGHGHI